MSQIYGLLGIPDYQADQTFVNTVGQQVVYDAIQEELVRINAELNAAASVFVEETTEEIKRRYKLPAGGYMQRRNRLGMPGATKQNGGWDVAFPLEDFGDLIATDDISLAYMSIKDLNLHIDSINLRAINTTRFAILQALLNNTQQTIVDERKGTLLIEPLANGDSVVYPPIIGSDNETTDNHYLVSGYTVANISDTNDPFPTVVAEISEHFGQSPQGDEIAVFFGSDQTAKIESLTGFESIADRHIEPGANANVVVGLPENTPGVVKGRHESGAWGIEWPRLPAGYTLTVHLGQPKPLIKRIDEAKSGLGQGLLLVARNQSVPLDESFYRMRQGFGVGNRLNGVVMQMKVSGSYDVPTSFAR